MTSHKRRRSDYGDRYKNKPRYPYWAWPLRLFGDWWDNLSTSDRVFWLLMTLLVFINGWIWTSALK